MTDGVTVDKLVRVFVKIRDARGVLKRTYEEEDAELKAQQDAIKAQLLEHCRDNDVTSVRTDSGMFYRTTKTRYWASDWPALHAFARENDRLDIFEKRLAQGVMKQLIEEDGDAVPGVNVDTEYVITVRKS